MGLRVRSLWIAAGAVAYVAFAALQATRGSAVAAALLVALPLGIAGVFRATAPPVRGEDRVDDGTRAGARAAFTGAAIAIAAHAGTGSAAFVAMENFGAGLASIGALVAFARIGAAGGMLAPASDARRLDAAAFGALLWTIAVALPTVRAVSARGADLEPSLVDIATAAASLGGLGLLLVTTLIVRVRRRFELGVADRAGAAFWLTFTVLLVGIGAAGARIVEPERLLPLACAVAAASVAASAVAREATTLARALRVIVALAAVVGPISLYAAYVARVAGARSAPFVAFACATASLAALVAPIVARRLLAPAAGRWLSALDAATRAAMTPDPDAALEAALLALRGAAGQRGTDPAIYHLGVPEIVRVDRAGYLHREKGEPPARLVELAEQEPEQVLRREVLDAVAVRRPDVRTLGTWLEQRSFSAAAVVRDDQGPVALLAIPAGVRRRAWTLEEVRALRALADRLGAVVGASAQLARSRMREVELRAELAGVRVDIDNLSRGQAREAARRRAVARTLARPAEMAAYSPAARAAADQLARIAADGRSITLLAPPGVDAAPWAALAHLASPRRDAPFVLVDGKHAVEHDLGAWREHATSPLEAARGGTLAIVDAHALPRDVQGYLAAALDEDAGLVVSLRATVDALVAEDALVESLADRLGDRAVALPGLAARPEDLQALSLELLGRIGWRLHRDLLGLEPTALALLLEHPWPGNDAELEATLLRAALVAAGPAITASDLEGAGFAPPASNEVRRSAFPSARRGRKKNG